MNKRLSPRINFQFPLTAILNIYEYNGQSIDSHTKRIDVHNVSLGGLCFSTNLNFPLTKDRPLTLKIIYRHFTVIGEIVWKEGIISKYYYGLKVKTCNLGFYKYCYQWQDMERKVN